ncbi:lysine--tRNA ligase [Buchnera aphidicola]|uniref:Lysine--tRNA ligase n=1 Tax=Buchnera aphidicola (Stegophylla sp.) TaxID=2315800 RepID=A0A4D6YLB1_9GAMM|nr:lysine--tRNA ligase [Buchnera aphidicola (Stegophylla sp.)]QCI26428.1 lysine--tRNA ligase [Buchnera aphidicola (Stegophylla sp.)]
MLNKKKKNNKNFINQNNEYETRKKKLQNIRQIGFDFPNHFKPNISIPKIYKKYIVKNHQELKKIHKTVKITGRMIQQRIMGKASFIIIKNMQDKIQIYVTETKISSEIYQKQFKTWDLGDILGIEGTIFKTKTQELSIYCTKIYLLCKSLRPLPNKFHGLLNQETKYRQRYLDLITNPQSMENFKTRSKTLTIIRNFMHNNNFIEVETPILQNIPGGATAKPFKTYHNTLHKKMYLRISPELYLKKLIIGGFNRIYEISRNFRNEGISSKHNPEFTMMELYMTYSNYQDLMNFIEKLMQIIIKKIIGSYKIKYNTNVLNLSPPYQRFTMKESILHYYPNIHKSDLKNLEITKKIANTLDINVKNHWNIGKIISEIFETTIEKKLIQPTFITEYPIEISPLSRRNNIKKHIADRFEFFIGGIEIGNGFSELNDSEDQKKRFLQQDNNKNQLTNQKISYNKEYITAMEYGLPPTAGLGIGIDRLIMIITNQKNIRDIILFPTLRNSKKNKI